MNEEEKESTLPYLGRMFIRELAKSFVNDLKDEIPIEKTLLIIYKEEKKNKSSWPMVYFIKFAFTFSECNRESGKSIDIIVKKLIHMFMYNKRIIFMDEPFKKQIETIVDTSFSHSYCQYYTATSTIIQILFNLFIDDRIVPNFENILFVTLVLKKKFIDKRNFIFLTIDIAIRTIQSTNEYIKIREFISAIFKIIQKERKIQKIQKEEEKKKCLDVKEDCLDYDLSASIVGFLIDMYSDRGILPQSKEIFDAYFDIYSRFNPIALFCLKRSLQQKNRFHGHYPRTSYKEIEQMLIPFTGRELILLNEEIIYAMYNYINCKLY